MAAIDDAKGALDVATRHAAYVRSQTNDRNQWSDADRGVEVARQHLDSLRGLDKPAPQGVPTQVWQGSNALVGALGGKR